MLVLGLEEVGSQTRDQSTSDWISLNPQPQL
jgi:hypothetical protein